jgi:predicted phosphate transport protein (TIGR00153 family)
MAFGFFPKHEKFFDLFDQSVENLREGARLLKALLEDYTDVEAKIKRIEDVEHKGDTLTHETIEHLNRIFVTPIDREDIHAIAEQVDDVLDRIDGAAYRLYLYEIPEPSESSRALADVLVRSVDEVALAVKALRNLRKPREIIDRCVRINTFENEADSILHKALAALFRDYKDPIMVIKWKEIYERLEDATDKCEDVANVLEGIVLKNA